MVYLIWWLSQPDCEAIGDSLPETWPEYLRDEYRSRLGRRGGGRLWNGLNAPGVDPWPNTHFTKHIGAKDCGGIVIREEDALLVAGYPGFITNYKMEFWCLIPS